MKVFLTMLLKTNVEKMSIRTNETMLMKTNGLLISSEYVIENTNS